MDNTSSNISEFEKYYWSCLAGILIQIQSVSHEVLKYYVYAHMHWLDVECAY